MINMNSPTVQTIIQSTGYNPFVNGQYVPQPQPMPMQNTYSYYSGYNPYIANQIHKNEIDNWQYSYDPMPQVVVNEARGINSNRFNNQNIGYNNNQSIYNGFNSSAFNGYINPVLMRNNAEAKRIEQRKEAINQGKIWRSFLKNVALEDEDFNIDEAVKTVESYYYQEPQEPQISIEDKMIIDKNRQYAELEYNLNYCRQNNIPIVTPHMLKRAKVYSYYNHIASIAGEDCDMVDYFTRVYPELKFQELERRAISFNKNLKNRYNSTDFNKLIDKVSDNRPDSYYYKLMQSFAEDGVRFETSNGSIITADQMEVRLPESLLRKRKNKQDAYYEQRKKFYDSVFKKET